jgi:hypothetical protein
MRKGKDPDPDTYLWLMDPDLNPGGPKNADPVRIPTLLASESVSDVLRCGHCTVLDSVLHVRHYCRKQYPHSSSMFSKNRVHVLSGDSNSSPPDQELGALTKWLASRMLVWASAGFTTIFWFLVNITHRTVQCTPHLLLHPPCPLPPSPTDQQ